MPWAASSITMPMLCEGMPVANSTASMPRCTSPSASARVLPLSRTTSSANSFRFSSSCCLKRKSTRARSTTGVSPQTAKAARAAATASSTSAAVASGSLARISPVAGLVTSSQSAAWESRASPPMKFLHLGIMGFSPADQAMMSLTTWP